ncbi:MAG: hypothetical protein A2358_00975 [Candidatus Staskawiczbacteria bacterium RIFOXYB1_FULL_37_44]|uniref:Uncharacterized protein n=1 Tax=Candidatus Staskawiczbacteria bacterium RIFOXYB1_FULL_37_44 TaxID=1802223 RepID=A0A1G2IWU5_9BACT|nr:MAG: hypothetical protein A2358_00975 [Candidatus Staskawiczbacteria bacterium RIFOXYB1_FULL_37_44]OGZ84738.1 MAG: hypothetical protein A2416_00985 [Candidatus Staskawiczbacteria bacterium RIFOXYC1_FULL_37_52]OGZ88443.1 MAG: hypothetical protein A2444_02130 [Candidatus Staskawiczbacteria bacterium RIFOXYC2_FULL_37_19]OGZ89635.1 MAG: hypothetical protein A2581_01495 [Candidatus Staskawiczbacteria bacterium RIFOXYD1_FULL_37_110]
MSDSETKICQNCKKDFTIEPDDFAFYEKIKVPPPTFCPDCRLQRRMAFRNELVLHRKKSAATEKEIISIFRSDSPMKVYEHEEFFSDRWDPLAYGQDYDFSRPFFRQLQELMLQTPTLALFDSKSTNSSYCNMTVEQKNCYLVSAAWTNEDCMYMNRVDGNKNSLDLYICGRNQFCYENVYCEDSYRLFYSHTCKDCNDSYFLYDCRGCSNCFSCAGLRNKNYNIFNKPYTKEEYFKKIKEFDMGDWNVVQDMKQRVAELSLSVPHRYAQIFKSTHAVGDHIHNVKNAYHCFDFLSGAENVKYSHWSSGEFKDSYDTGPGTGGNSELLYESVSIGVQSARCMFNFVVWYSHDVQYSINCHSSNNLFGCVSLRNKSYCIFNKQYSKEEYETLVPKIIEHMNSMPYVDAKGRVYKYGEFLPIEISPIPYNDTVAQDYMPLTKEEADVQGHSWGKTQSRNYKITKRAADSPVKISDAPDNITQETIGCMHEGKCQDGCATAFRITPDELKFYKNLQIPLPRLCFACRHKERLKQRNPMTLWHRKCMKEGCSNEFETSYAPDRPEIVYCEQCYQQEVA